MLHIVLEPLEHVDLQFDDPHFNSWTTVSFILVLLCVAVPFSCWLITLHHYVKSAECKPVVCFPCGRSDRQVLTGVWGERKRRLRTSRVTLREVTKWWGAMEGCGKGWSGGQESEEVLKWQRIIGLVTRRVSGSEKKTRKRWLKRLLQGLRWWSINRLRVSNWMH